MGFDAANISIPLYSDGSNKETIKNLEAQTYNIENGEITITKLNPKSVFDKKMSKNLTVKEFSFPSVKEGSIIELSYMVNSDFISHLLPWDIQGVYPCIRSELNVQFPDFLKYEIFNQGNLNYNSFTKDSTKQLFRVVAGLLSNSSIIVLNANVYHYKWVYQDVPALIDEEFISTKENYTQRINFQLAEYELPDRMPQKIMSDWQNVTSKLNWRDDFGVSYLLNIDWLKKDLKIILQGTHSELEKTKKIFEFVRDNFKSTSNYGIYITEELGLKEVFRKKSGSVSEINLLLLAMLHHESIVSAPIILSLRDRGWVHPKYPLMERFNYLICGVTIDGNSYFLDASDPILGFNQLHYDCYNGLAWVINFKETKSINLSTDLIHEQKYVTVLLMNDSNRLAGKVMSQAGHNESYNIRKMIAKNGKDAYAAELKSKFPSGLIMENVEVDSLKSYEQPVKTSYDISLKFDEDIVYFNPMLDQLINKNLFKSSERRYPIELPNMKDVNYILNLEIPTGYAVDELPKSERHLLGENDGLFEYLILQKGSQIQFKYTLKINRTNFDVEDYKSLRTFYTIILKKQSEQIVFKKS
jgi:hypothetical protein